MNGWEKSKTIGSLHKQNTERLRAKGWNKILQANRNQKRDRINHMEL